MPTAEARVQTPRAERYLVQLVDHLTQLGQHGPGQHSQHGPEQHSQFGHGQHGGPEGQPHGGPPVVRDVERTDRQARIEFDWGRLKLAATATEFVLMVEADDPHALARGQELITRRVETIGRRDELTVAWQVRGSDEARG